MAPTFGTSPNSRNHGCRGIPGVYLCTQYPLDCIDLTVCLRDFPSCQMRRWNSFSSGPMVGYTQRYEPALRYYLADSWPPNCARRTECRTAELLPFYLCALFSPVLEAGLTFTPSQTVHGMAPCLSLSVFSRSRAILLDLTPRLSASRAQPEPPLGAEVKNLSSSLAAHFTGKFVVPFCEIRVCMHCRGAAVNPQQQQIFEIDVYRSSI
jgi:hypothetical protein